MDKKLRTLKKNWSCQGSGCPRGIFSLKDPHTSVPAFLLHSAFITFGKITTKQASNYCRPPKTERCSMSDSYLSKWLFWGNFTSLSFLQKRQTRCVLKSLLVFPPQWPILGPFRVGLPGEISIFQTHALRRRRGYDFVKHADPYGPWKLCCLHRPIWAQRSYNVLADCSWQSIQTVWKKACLILRARCLDRHHPLRCSEPKI